MNLEPAEQYGKAAAHYADAAAPEAPLRRRELTMRQAAASVQPATGITRVQLIFREIGASAVTRGAALIDDALQYAPEGVRKHARSRFPGVLGAPSPHIPTPLGEDAANAELDAGTAAAPETGHWMDNALFADDEPDGR